jgi:hypothetical protein
MYRLTHGHCPDSLDDLDVTIPENPARYVLAYDKNNSCVVTLAPLGKPYKIMVWGLDASATIRGTNCVANTGNSYAEEICSAFGNYSFTGSPSNSKYYLIRQ